MNQSRRNHTRYKVAEKSYAAVTPEYHILGPIQDIGKGGLCFTYIHTPSSSTNSESSSKESVTLLLSSVNCCVGKIPFKTVDDYEVSPSSFFSMSVRKRHIQFCGLSEKKLAEIDRFLESTCAEPLESTYTNTLVL